MYESEGEEVSKSESMDIQEMFVLTLYMCVHACVYCVREGQTETNRERERERA